MTDPRGFWVSVRCPCCDHRHLVWAEPPPVLAMPALSDHARRILATAPENWRRGHPCPTRTLADFANLSKTQVLRVLRGELVAKGYAATVPYRTGAVQYIGVPSMIARVSRELIA